MKQPIEGVFLYKVFAGKDRRYPLGKGRFLFPIPGVCKTGIEPISGAVFEFFERLKGYFPGLFLERSIHPKIELSLMAPDAAFAAMTAFLENHVAGSCIVPYLIDYEFSANLVR